MNEDGNPYSESGTRTGVGYGGSLSGVKDTTPQLGDRGDGTTVATHRIILDRP